jgi:hypothetical protein
MAPPEEQIRVSDQVQRLLDSHPQEGESYTEVLERILDEEPAGDVDDGFGGWSEEQAEGVRDRRQYAKDGRKNRLLEEAEDEG